MSSCLPLFLLPSSFPSTFLASSLHSSPFATSSPRRNRAPAPPRRSARPPGIPVGPRGNTPAIPAPIPSFHLFLLCLGSTGTQRIGCTGSQIYLLTLKVIGTTTQLFQWFFLSKIQTNTT